jgi:hypothetical protein
VTTFWSPSEQRILRSFHTPFDIQRFLETLTYSVEERYRSPRSVMRDRKAHCFDGALLAAAGLKYLGHRPLIVDLQADDDDDHVIAVFKERGLWGAVAQSNFAPLRFRDPVFRSVRELVMSYWDCYFSYSLHRSLRMYTHPVNLNRFRSLHWETDDAAMDAIADHLEITRKHIVATPAQARRLSPADKRSQRSLFVGANPKGIYRG